MTWQIALMFVLLIAAFVSFVREKIPPDLTALTLFVIVICAGLVPATKAFAVFGNPAPLTVAAMFVLSAALVKCGAIDRLSTLIDRAAGWPYPLVMFLMVVIVAGASAFVNNTPVVVVFLPVVLSLARKMRLAPSKLLIPLSYAAILGGTCTLIGTSTNLVVNGIALTKGQQPLRMFELTWLGAPTALIGAVYLALAGRRLLPDREMLTSILSAEERREYITEAFVQPDSPALGKSLAEAGLTSARGIRTIEIVREGVALDDAPTDVRLQAGDRLILACRPKGIVHTRNLAGIDLTAELNLGLEQIAAHEGSLVEGVIRPRSELVGRTIHDINFRQRFRMVVLAVHREGRNVRDQLGDLPLEGGDVLLLMGTDTAIQILRSGDDILLFDQPALPARSRAGKIPLVLGVIAAAVVAASFNWLPIEIGALAGCVALCLTGCLKPKEAYNSIEWNILFLIFGMLVMGLALEETGAAAYLAHKVVAGVQLVVPPAHKAIAMLACVYLVTMVLTEMLSNNAVAALMAPLAIGIAQELGVNPRAFIVAVAFAASAAFSTPIGYQTNTYVYGVGGYKFGDFVKIGAPLNVLCFVMAVVVIPVIWKF